MRKNALLILILTACSLTSLSQTMDTTFFYPTNTQWENYRSIIEKRIASVFVDVSLIDKAPVPHHSTIVLLSLKMRESDIDGLTTTREVNQLLMIEDSMMRNLNRTGNILYAGNIVTKGYKNFYFYTDSIAACSTMIQHTLTSFPTYKYKIQTQEDPYWAIYAEVLYPREEYQQMIENSKTVLVLSQNGDPLTTAREVKHTIHFRDIYNREDFITKAAKNKYTVVSKTDSDDPFYPHALVISRKDFVDIYSVNEYTLDLWYLAREYNGNYAGWQTVLRKD
jgi:uncharacterized protein (TIGR01619 family)